MIPKEITRQNILSSIHTIDHDGVPEGRNSRKFTLVYNGKAYPPKYVVALANKYANGHELDPSDFNGGKETNDFLIRLGFEIRDDSTLLVSPVRPMSRSKQSGVQPTITHNERCPECKRTIESMLTKIFGEFKCGYRFKAGVKPEDYISSPLFPYLKEIYLRLQTFRGFTDFVRTSELPEVDYYIPDPGFILEFDESQHFTYCRKESLIRYPDGLNTGFDVNKWIDLCEKTDAKDNDPPFRDEQRAWYDTLRDFLPSIGQLHPTIRLYSKSLRWCDLNPESETDVKKFLTIMEGKKPQWVIKTKETENPSLARIIIAGEWEGEVNTSSKLLNEICDIWPRDKRVNCLVTCGAFLNFDWPRSLIKVRDNINPDKSIINLLIDKAQVHIDLLLTPEIKNKLLSFTDYITIGIDSHKDKISLSSVSIRQPHAELVVVVDLKGGRYFWTGKSYPTIGQEKGLVRVTDLSNHFIDLSFGKVLILGCHDLNIFSPRGEAVTKSEWRKKVRADFYDLVRKEMPDFVLHHPHTTDSSKIWTAAWNNLAISYPSVKKHLSAGRYFRKEGERSGLCDVLRNTKRGNTIDFIVETGK